MAYPLTKTIADSDFKSNPERHGLMPGMIWEVNGQIGAHSFKTAYVHGRSAFIWACNRSGAALSRGALTKFYTTTGTATGGSTSTVVDSAAPFVADEEVWNMLMITDNNNSAGAAPETEGGMIIKNTTSVLTVRTPLSGQVFSAAVEANDTFTIRSTCQVIASVIGDQDSEICGITMAASLADNSWGWLCLQADMVWALVKAAQAITTDKGLIVDTGRLTIGSGSGMDLMLAYALASYANDIVSDLIPVRFRSPYLGQATSQ